MRALSAPIRGLVSRPALLPVPFIFAAYLYLVDALSGFAAALQSVADSPSRQLGAEILRAAPHLSLCIALPLYTLFATAEAVPQTAVPARSFPGAARSFFGQMLRVMATSTLMLFYALPMLMLVLATVIGFKVFLMHAPIGEPAFVVGSLVVVSILAFAMVWSLKLVAAAVMAIADDRPIESYLEGGKLVVDEHLTAALFILAAGFAAYVLEHLFVFTNPAVAGNAVLVYSILAFTTWWTCGALGSLFLLSRGSSADVELQIIRNGLQVNGRMDRAEFVTPVIFPKQETYQPTRKTTTLSAKEVAELLEAVEADAA